MKPVIKIKKKKVFVAMSGGVDSSVAAYLLKKQGYEVTGAFMRCWGGSDGFDAGVGVNCAERDAEDARRVAEKLEIPFYVWDFEDEYKARVVDYMIAGYGAGLTPNPDVMCNREIKFGLFFDRARLLGADYVATGHYVALRPLAQTAVRSLRRLAPTASHSYDSGKAEYRAHQNSESFSIENPAQFGLFQAKDKNKDQSYFLWTLTQKKIRHCLFPVGGYLKPKVREIARKAGLPTAEKKDSQGICFLGKVTLGDFLENYIPKKRGAVLTATGEKIGEHEGVQFYTIGQRHIGASLNFKRAHSAAEGRLPYYVSKKDIKTNTLIVAEGRENPSLYKKAIFLNGVNFISEKTADILKNGSELNVMARVRYRQPLKEAKIKKESKKYEYKLIFKEPQNFIAPGQSAVFYLPKKDHDKTSKDTANDLLMLGGGVILRSS